MNKLLALTVICLIFVCTALCINRLIFHQPQVEVRTETKYLTDTIVIRDTIVIDNPIPLTQVKYKDRYFHDTVYVNKEPILADIPIEEKIYADERYEAIVSGFKPKLEKLTIYTKDMIINNEIQTTITKTNNKSRFALSLQGGISVNKDFKPYPYIGVGISFDIYRFNKR